MTVRVEDGPWPLSTIGDECDILDRMRKPINSSDRSNRRGIYPYYGANGQVGTIDDYLFDDELVLVAEDGGFFFDLLRPIAYRVSGKCWVNNHAHVLRPLERLDVDWLCLSIAYQDVSARVKGATRPKLNQKDLLGIPIPLPPLPEQQRIVGRIKECMNRVEEVERLQLEGIREISALIPSVLNTYETSSALKKMQLGNLLDSTSNGRSIRQTTSNGNGYVLTLSAVRPFELDVLARKAVNVDDVLRDRFRIRKNDIFVSRSNTRDLVGLSAIASEDYPLGLIYPDLLIRLRVHTLLVRPRYLAYALRFPSVRQQIQERSTGTSQSMVKISGERLRTVEIPIGTLKEQDTAIRTLDVACGIAQQLPKMYDETHCPNLRSTILRKAFAGEL